MKYLHVIFLVLICSLGQAQVPVHIFTDSLQGYYTFHNDLADSSGNGHDGSLVGSIDYDWSPTWSATPPSAFFYGGTLVNCGDVDAFEGTATFSAHLWFYCMDMGGPQESEQVPIFSKWSTVNDVAESSYKVFIDGSNLVVVFSDGVTMDSVSVDVMSVGIEPWFWNSLGITFENGIVRLFLWGNEIANDTLSISSINNSGSDFKLGGWNSDSNSSYANFTGRMDDVAIYNRVLSDCEMIYIDYIGMPGFVEISANQGVLYTLGNNGQYQWLDCSNNYSPIPGETANNFEPTTNGSYALQLIYSGCTDTSQCITLNNVGMEEMNIGHLQIHPNPVSDELHISSSGELIQEAQILDARGQVIRIVYVNDISTVIDVSQLNPGIYLIRVEGTNQRFVKL